MSTPHTLSNLPTEIHHTIFTFLDYIRDICCDPFLFTPCIEMRAITVEEFEQFNGMDRETIVKEEYLDFEHPNRVPFFLASKSLLHSVKWYQPTLLNLTVFSTRTKPCRYSMDACYFNHRSLGGYSWFNNENGHGATSKITEMEWMDCLLELVRKMRRLCRVCDPFSKVEFISFSKKLGRNYLSADTYVGGPRDPDGIVKLFPCLKYAIFNYFSRPFSTMNSLTTIHTLLSQGVCSYLVQDNNAYYMKDEKESQVSIEILKTVFPKKYPINIEYLLFNYLFSDRRMANYVIDNFVLNVNLFSHICNIQADIQKTIEYDDAKEIMDTLNNFYKKYPTFRLFRFRIASVENLKLIMSYPFVDINPSKNITKLFLDKINIDQMNSIAKEYNIDCSKLGTFQFSAACLSSRNIFPIEENTTDIFGVSPAMYTLENGIDIHTRDKFGNNILHYICCNRFLPGTTRRKLIREEVFKILGGEPNMFGVTPNELALLVGCEFKVESFSKKFNYESFLKTFGRRLSKFSLFDGLVLNEKMYCAVNDNLLTSRYNYDEYRDINYRDENGKHLCHYSTDCFNDNFKLLNLDFKDIAFCKDNNQTMPIQLYDGTYFSVLNELGKLGNMPKQNYFGHMDNFGMCRYLYLLTIHGINTERMIKEANTIGFDYSSGKPELVALCSHILDGHYHFTIEKTPLKQLKAIRYYGSVDGDDFSHFLLRCYFDHIRKYSDSNLDTSILKALINRGLLFDIVRNSEGHTAFDLIENFTGTPRMMSLVKQLRNVCWRGLTKKSKAIPQFKIKHNPIPGEKQDSETNLILKTHEVSHYRIRIKRSLYFRKL